jgi:hypothetical protein
MTTTRFATAVGLALGAVWALAGFDGMLVAAALAVVGFLVGLVLDGRIDVTEFLGHRHRDESGL